MTKLLIASNNQGKVDEIRALLQELDFELVTPRDMGLELSVDESGQTYAENARLKALAFVQESGILTLADDSGLEVKVLGGAPGLHSARFSPLPGANDADRRAYLLERLLDKPRPWTASFRCVIVIASPDGMIYTTQGSCDGEIIPEERGINGFGYDPIFFFSELGKTMAELEMVHKNRLSHRANAVLAARPILVDLLTNMS